jgi:hypothetical protein
MCSAHSINALCPPPPPPPKRNNREQKVYQEQKNIVTSEGSQTQQVKHDRHFQESDILTPQFTHKLLKNRLRTEFRGKRRRRWCYTEHEHYAENNIQQQQRTQGW